MQSDKQETHMRTESLGWFGKELQQLQASPCINLFIHVSREEVVSEDCSSLDSAPITADVEKGKDQTGGQAIPLSIQLKGRPDIANLLASCISQCSLESRIGVGACGPVQMIQATRDAIYQSTYDNGPSITLHTEVSIFSHLNIAPFAPY